MRVLVTRPRAQAAEFVGKLQAAGHEPVCLPVIEICAIQDNPALRRALARLDSYAWMVFTSANAVDVVCTQLPAERSAQGLGVRAAAIGPKTAEALRKFQVEPDFIPQEYLAEAILPGLGDLAGQWVLLPRAEIARQELPQAIFQAGGVPHEITVYKTLPARPDPDGLAALRAGVDVLTFTSESTVHNFVALARQNRLDPLDLPGGPHVVCIGPITAQAARQAGFQNVGVAQDYTTAGLLEFIQEMELS